MKWLFTISLLISTQFIFSQRSGNSLEDTPELLAKQIIAPFNTDRQKVTAIFRWITDNISYKTTPTYERSYSSKRQPWEDDDTAAIKPLNERVAEAVLKERTGVCNGYSKLFTTLCDFAGIRSEIITGYAKANSNKPGARFGANHYWNAVYFDSAWHLLDATWASGYVTRQGTEFVRDYDAQYFLAKPENFIKDHYPDDPRWTLLSFPPMPGEFSNSPFKQKSFIKYQISSYYPKKGIIDVSLGDTIRLALETKDPNRDKEIAPDLLMDTTIFSHSSSWVFLKPDNAADKPNKLNYSYIVTSPDVEWIYLVYNDDLVLRYKIRMKKELATN
ncbi:MAG: transglutaminase domain-containing protein [Bacteroidota bacterium]